MTLLSVPCLPEQRQF